MYVNSYTAMLIVTLSSELVSVSCLLGVCLAEPASSEVPVL